MSITLLQGDCRELLDILEPGSVQVIVTSPPYWRLRKYTDDPREIGQEPTPAEYVQSLVDVFAKVWRVLRDDGALFLNLGDSYANDTKWGGKTSGKHASGLQGTTYIGRNRMQTGLPSKSLIGLPWRVAFALQDAGWILRNDCIWHKPACFPENVDDRFTRDHEYIFFFTKQPHYYFNANAVREESAPSSQARAQYNGREPSRKSKAGSAAGVWQAPVSTAKAYGQGRNKRTVWSIPLQPLRDEHYAAYPQRLVETCLLAATRPGDTVLDPFAGSGTTGRAALALQRKAVLIDLGYSELQERRTDGVQVQMVELL